MLEIAEVQKNVSSKVKIGHKIEKPNLEMKVYTKSNPVSNLCLQNLLAMSITSEL
jgi:hypothetical protein